MLLRGLGCTREPCPATSVAEATRSATNPSMLAGSTDFGSRVPVGKIERLATG
eukprot:SAG31_NODE_197_length_20660_cov_8.861368_10_plen_53_part_00